MIWSVTLKFSCVSDGGLIEKKLLIYEKNSSSHVREFNFHRLLEFCESCEICKHDFHGI